MKEEFSKELTALINRYSIDNDFNTPDYIITTYLINCLNAYHGAVKTRDGWFGFIPF